MFTVIIFLAVFSALVLVHELGHFWTARLFKVRAEEFGLGMPPRLFGIYRLPDKRWRFFWGNRDSAALPVLPEGTVYSLNWLPLGGFVKIKGQDGESQEADSFASKKIWQRFIILAAGVIMNIIFAAFLFTAGFMIGAPQSVSEGGEVKITEVVANSPAASVDLKIGDTLMGVDSQVLNDVGAYQTYIGQAPGQEITLKIKRQDKELNISVTPENKDGRGLIGVGLDQVDTVRYPFFKAIVEGFKHAGLMLWLILVAFFQLIKGLFIGAPMADAVGGPIRIAQMTGEVARFGFANLINFTALLSINLAVLNFLPFPALDGGRAVFLLIEKLRGKPVKKEVEAWINNAGFLLLMGLILLVTYQDIARFFR